ncbi:MAG TPA: site-2 protease family protein [Gemmatimonadales bacterium]
MAPVLLFSVVAHEYAHAEAAYRQGDPTAHMLGRLTLNPLKHIDPVMTVLFPAMLWFASGGRFMFAAAKPVPVNPRNYRNFRRGDIIVSLAGIVTNIGLFLIAALLFAVVGLVGGALHGSAITLTIVQRMLWWTMWLNLLLAFFNLLPIPPLDGSHVFKYLLSPQAHARYQQLYRYGYLPLFAFLIFVRMVPAAAAVYLWPASTLMNAALSVVGGFALGEGAFPI